MTSSAVGLKPGVYFDVESDVIYMLSLKNTFDPSSREKKRVKTKTASQLEDVYRLEGMRTDNESTNMSNGRRQHGDGCDNAMERLLLVPGCIIRRDATDAASNTTCVTTLLVFTHHPD